MSEFSLPQRLYRQLTASQEDVGRLTRELREARTMIVLGLVLELGAPSSERLDTNWTGWVTTTTELETVALNCIRAGYMTRTENNYWGYLKLTAEDISDSDRGMIVSTWQE